MIHKDKKTKKFYFRAFVFDNKLNKKVQKTRKGFSTKKEAELAEKEFIKNYNNQFAEMWKEEKKKVLTFKTAFKLFYENEIQQIKESSRHGLYQKLDKNILQYFKNQDVKNISHEFILSWYTNLNNSNLSTVYKNTLLKYFKKIFKFISIVYGINNSYVLLLKPFRRNDAEIKITKTYTEEEFNKFISVIKDPLIVTFFSTLFYSGLRLAEIRAITWNDIDFIKQYIDVNKSLNRVEGGSKIMYPKTQAAMRQVYIPDKLVQQLIKLNETASKRIGYSNSWYVFGEVKPIYESCIREWKKKYATIAGLHEIKIHGFRHSYISMLFDKGMNPKFIQKQVGHADISTTLNIYTHIENDKISDEIKKI